MAARSIMSNEEFLEEILGLTKKYCIEWCEILDTLGMQDETVINWRKAVRDSVEDTFDDLNGQALEVQKRMIGNIEQLLEKAEKLCKKLHLKLPAYGSEKLSLYEEKRRLQIQVEKYEQQIEEKLKEIAALEKRQNEVCNSLGLKPQPLSADYFPTETELSALLERIESLEEEQFAREEQYLNIRENVLAIVNELGVKPSLEIEKIVLSDNVSLFLPTDSNMKWLKEYHHSLLEQEKQTRAEITEEWEKLHNLWDLLQEDIQARSEFTSKHVGNSLLVLEALKKEVRRCKDLKEANIQKFVARLRTQMQDLWEKCHFSTEQRDNFEFFHETYYTEDLLTLHDMEVNKLKKYYNENKEILSLLEKREELWSRMLNLEQRSMAPDRFKNRGGQLLKEEKERNKLQKSIPEMEAKIVQFAEQYRQREGKAFTSRGLTVQEIISRSYDMYNEEKKLKLSARKQQRELTTTPGKSYLNPTTSSTHNLLTPSTPATNTKRKLVVPLFSDAKRQKNAGLKSAPPKLQVNNKTIARRYSRHSYDRKKRVEKLRKISNSMRKKKPSESSCNTTYRDFEKEMSSKQACRSTFHADQSSEILAMPLSEITNACNTPKSFKRKLKEKVHATKSGLKVKPGQTKLQF